jgi:hypothetical protein
LGQDGRVTSGDLLGEAVEELYSADPEEFTQRRGELAAAARSAGQAATARQIAALRKPTRSAWVINQLARTDPDAVSRLAELGEELRAAERSRDGSNLRELSQARRQLIAALVRQALAASGQQGAPAVLREDITATLAAALADPEVAGQIQLGMLLRPARRSGFGTEQGPALALVPPPDTATAGTTGRAGPSAGRAAADTDRVKAGRGRRAVGEPDEALAGAGREHGAEADAERAEADTERAEAERAEAERAEAGAERAEAKADAGRAEAGTGRAEAERAEAERAEAERAEAERAAAEAEAERERREARAHAEQALAEADSAVQAARSAEHDLQDTVRRLEQQLIDLRRRLHEARTQARQAEIVQRKARQVLGRLPE